MSLNRPHIKLKKEKIHKRSNYQQDSVSIVKYLIKNILKPIAAKEKGLSYCWWSLQIKNIENTIKIIVISRWKNKPFVQNKKHTFRIKKQGDIPLPFSKTADSLYNKL